MSDRERLAAFEAPVFFIHEEGDDFTFYLDAHTNFIKTEGGYIAINDFRLENPNPSVQTSTGNATENKTKEQFSFSGKLVVQDLGFTGGLESVGDHFWKRLTDASDAPCKYVLGLISTNASKPLTDDQKAVIEKISRSNLDSEERTVLLSLFGEALRTANVSALNRQGWIKNHGLSPEEKRFLNLLKRDARGEWRKRFLIRRVFPEFCRTGRGLICYSQGGYLSVTFRKLSDKNQGYEANRRLERKIHLFSLHEYCDQVYEQVFTKTGSSRNAHGLLVVTGSTNSAKSEIARGLIHKYLTQPRAENERKRHLVTFEDPIEVLFPTDQLPKEQVRGEPFIAAKPSGNPEGVNYTARQKGRDVGLLEEALADALRQTPTVVFVGETRDRKEWELLLNFAATGHLIVTTAHAGSLVEAMHNIFEARRVKTRAQRSEVAHKLLGVIHLKGDKIPFFPDSLFKRPPGFVSIFDEPEQTLLSKFLYDQFQSASPGLLKQCASNPADKKALACLVDEANKLLSSWLYEDERFKGIDLSPETRELLRRNPDGKQLILLNRMLLEDAFPDEQTSKTNVLFPALWRRTPRGVAALTADGLTSLLPHRPNNDSPSCVGRRWFTQKLIDEATTDLDELVGVEERERITTRVKRTATGLDLRGE